MKLIATEIGYYRLRLIKKGEVFDAKDDILKIEYEKDDVGKLKLDEYGKPIPQRNKEGHLVFQRDKNGRLIFPKWARPAPDLSPEKSVKTTPVIASKNVI